MGSRVSDVFWMPELAAGGVLYPDLEVLKPDLVPCLRSLLEGDMLTLPLPLIIALLLGFLFLKSLASRSMSTSLLALLLGCALQNLVVALSVHYGLSAFRMIQPICGAIIPPLAYVAFQDNVLRRVRPLEILPHCVGPLLVVFCFAFLPEAIDAVLVALFVLYGLLILVPIVQRSVELPRARLEAGEVPRVIWLGIAGSLLLSAVMDVSIAWAMSLGEVWLRPVLITISSSLVLLLIGGLSLSPAIGRSPFAQEQDEDLQAPDPEPRSIPADVTPADGAPADGGEDAELVSRLDKLLEEDALYLDPDLTLARLARRLLVPAKSLSAAVNRASGDNVSRYINGYRIRHACAALQGGASVTSAMLDSGFNTKSNFNREFSRLTGKTPSAWKAGLERGEGIAPDETRLQSASLQEGS